jgi:hypothetical protein
MNYICITYVRSRCGNRQLATAMAFVLGLPAGIGLFGEPRLSRRRSWRVFQNITANPTEYGRFEYAGLPVNSRLFIR